MSLLQRGMDANICHLEGNKSCACSKQQRLHGHPIWGPVFRSAKGNKPDAKK